jgi:hypothetical protein
VSAPRTEPALRRIFLIAAVAATLLACQAGGPGPASSPTGSPGAAAHPTREQQQAWKACGATATPPASALATPTDLPPVENQTQGAVTDADARTWAAGFAREQALEAWAQTALQPAVLQGGCLGDQAAAASIFGSEIAGIQRAQQVHGKVTVQLPRVLDLKLVPVPPSVQDQIKNMLQSPSLYALVVHGRGPSATRVVHPDGSQEPVGSEVKADQVYYAFFGGEYRAGAGGVGPLWYQKSAVDCLRDFLRPVCNI